MRKRTIQNGAFLVLLVLVTLAFFRLLLDFFQPLFWASVLAVLFHPVHRKWAVALGNRNSIAALLSLLTIVLLVLIPLFIVGYAVTVETITVYKRIATGDLDVTEPLRWIELKLPELGAALGRYGFDLARMQAAVSGAAVTASQFIATRALSVGQDALRIAALSFVMLYVLFFLLRDGNRILDGIVRALPLGRGRQTQLYSSFANVARGTLKGTLVIGAIQGTLGGVFFLIVGIGAPVLWGALMGIASILPAIGPAIVWLPAALIFLVSGEWLKGIILIVAGLLVIGLVDNFLRPILVGRDTKMPDYLILVSTLGGLTLFGVTGLVLGPVIAGLFLVVWKMFEQELDSARETKDQLKLPGTDGTAGPLPPE